MIDSKTRDSETTRVSEPCLACGGRELQKQRRYRTKSPHGKAIFQDSWLCQCEECGMVQAVPSPSQQELVDYYLRDYREGICAGLDVADPVKFPKDNLFYFNRGQSVATLN